MDGQPLSTEERKDLIRLGRRIKSVKGAIRIRVILALDAGYSIADTAKLFLLDEDTVAKWKRKYQDKRFFSDWLEEHHTGYEGKLTPSQIKEIEEFVGKHTITDSREVATFIKEHFQKEYTIDGATKLLHRLGFVYKQITRIPGKINEEKQQEFLSQYELMRRDKKEDEVVLFGDGVHPTHNIHTIKAWIKKGGDKQIKTNTGRGRLNINGALDPETLEVTIHVSDTINAQETIHLLDKLQERYRGKKISLIVDNATYYKNKEVTEYLARPGCMIKLIFLPPYSPNLNFIERLWKFMKKYIIGVTYREKFAQFKKDILLFFEHIDEYKDKLRPFIGTKLHLMKVAI